MTNDIMEKYQGIKTIVGSQAFVRLLTVGDSIVIESRFRFPRYVEAISDYFNNITRLVDDQGRTRLIAQKDNYSNHVTVLINAVFRGENGN